MQLSGLTITFSPTLRVVQALPEGQQQETRCCVNKQTVFNPLRPNNDLTQTSHCNIKGLSVKEVMRIENVITQVKFY